MMEALRFKLTEWFKPQPQPEALPMGDVAWSEPSAIYSFNNFEKYNPDALIGRKGYAIYQRMMQDEQVKAVIKFKRDAISSRDFMFELDNNIYELSDAEQERRLNLSYAVISNLTGSWMDALNNILSAQQNGYSLTEKIFEQFDFQGKAYWGVRRLKLRPYDTFYFHVDPYGNVIKLTQKIAGEERDVDPEKFIHFVVNLDVDEHYGQSELRAAYRAWFSKEAIIKFRNMWYEKHAGGFYIAKPKEGTTLRPGTPEYTKLQAILENINVSTKMILPSGIDVDGHYPTKDVDWGKPIDNCDMQIARSMLVPNLLGVSPQGQHGSLAQSDTQLEAFFWTLEADTTRLEDVLNEQLFRQLGAVNFGDDAWPRIRFKPMSQSRIYELVGKWSDLVSKGAARATQTDADHIRELLGFPEAGEPLSQPPPQLQPGGQGSPFPSQPSAEPQSGNAPQDKPPASGTNNPPGEMPTQQNSNEHSHGHPDETVIGRTGISVSAFDRALKRVDFAVIESSSEQSVTEGATEIGSVMFSMIKDLAAQVNDENVVKDIKALNKVKPDSKLKKALQSRIKGNLKDAWNIGLRHGKNEVDKAKKQSYAANAERMDLIGLEYFDIKSFKVAGGLTDDVVKMLTTIILNGAKGGKSTRDVIQQIYEEAARQGYVSVSDLETVLDQPTIALLQQELSANGLSRVNTMVRTNTFEAINEARYSYFTDPGLGGYVQALEYSAILDVRTTSICRHLDGSTYRVKSDVWSEYKPPNHYNCRSLLVPVTKDDTWTESDPPDVEPQRGFK